MKRFLMALVLSVFSLSLSAAPVYASSAVVGDGTPASCTEAAFDAALAAANAGGGEITFNCGSAVHTIQFSTAKTILLANVTINGGSRIILNAASNERHFFAGPVTFHLKNITLQQGDSLVNGGSIEASGAQLILENVTMLNNRSTVTGGAIYCYDGSLTISNSLFQLNQADTGGAIYNDGCALSVLQTTFLDNHAIGAFGRGGAIENSVLGTLIVQNSLFQNNSALDGGGIFNAAGASATLAGVTFQSNAAGYGGGLENNGTLGVTDSLFDDNAASGVGGGLWNIGGMATLERTTFSNNFAYQGGGVNSYGTALQMRDVNFDSNVANSFSGGQGGGFYHAGGTAFLTNATFTNNFAAGNGGAIYQNSDDNLTLTNVTLANNLASSLGGAIYHYGRYALLTNVTFANNLAAVAGNAIYEDSPRSLSSPGVIQMVNSLVFGSSNNCDGVLFDSFGNNLSAGACGSLNTVSDQENYSGDLHLGALNFYGGSFPMKVIPLFPGSPLIDTGNNGFCPLTDQLGASRPLDGDHDTSLVCDIGAYETSGYFQLFLPMIVR